MPQITITLPDRHAARRMRLVAQQETPHRWRIVGTDHLGYVAKDVRVDGKPLPTFRTLEAAQRKIASLPDADCVWATPPSHSLTSYVVIGQSGSYEVRSL